MSQVLAWIVPYPIVSHCLVGLGMMALICLILLAFRVHGWAWHAAGAVSLFFYAREAAQAERALKPLLGDPSAFFVTLWPGNWSAGGARVSEWLAPTLLCVVVAALLPREPRLGRRSREMRLGREGRSTHRPGDEPRPRRDRG